MSPLPLAFQRLEDEIITCQRCPRLRSWCLEVAQKKKAAYRDQEYWGLPVPGFGDPDAHLLIVGLAPAAHGANRTGRMFTGDRSGDFLYAALHRAGLANQPTATHRDDGLRLKGVWIGASARCAPPANKPSTEELQNCRPWLEQELRLLGSVRAVLTLGRIGHETLLKALKALDRLPPDFRAPFAHGAVHPLPGGQPTLVCSYHVSQQNTFTGRLTEAMFDAVLQAALDAR